jgi:hypothetical protein
MKLLQLPTNTTHIDIFRKGMPVAEASNSMVEQAMEAGCEYILFIDDDTQPPPQTILMLMQVLENSEPEVMACGGIYCTKVNPPEPIVYLEHGQGAHWDWKMGDVFPCWALGKGCLMIRMEIFKLMPKPWFAWPRTREEVEKFSDLFPDMLATNSQIFDVSDDIFFFTRLRQMGFKVLAHGGVLPIHWSADNKPYWLPQGIGPTKGVTLNGKPFGWVNPELELQCR